MSVIHDVWWTAAVDASRGQWVDAVSGLDGRISDDIISADPTRVRPKKKKIHPADVSPPMRPVQSVGSQDSHLDMSMGPSYSRKVGFFQPRL